MLDTDVLIAALDRADAHHRKAARAIEEMAAGQVELVISTINYAEALVRPAESEETLKVAVDAIAALGIGFVSPTATIARDAARHRARGISLADGFALATAVMRDATVASFDRRVRRAARSVNVPVAP